jgi:hypothetical protein
MVVLYYDKVSDVRMHTFIEPYNGVSLIGRWSMRDFASGLAIQHCEYLRQVIRSQLSERYHILPCLRRRMTPLQKLSAYDNLEDLAHIPDDRGSILT